MNKWTLLRWQVTLLLVLYFVMYALPSTVVAQTISTFDITLQKLGYSETQLVGPVSTVQYDFSLPASWQPQMGSYVEFDLDYVVSTQGPQYPPTLLEVRLNDQLLHTERIENLGAFKLLVYMPPSGLLLAENEFTNDLKLTLIVDEECERALLASLTVRTTSKFHFVYQKRAPRVDLSLYPKPLYQDRTFEPAQVRFVLPSEMDSTNMRAATMIASRLGELAFGRVPISATLSSNIVPGTVLKEHLIIIGQPDDNPLIQQLALPVPLAERRLSLTSQMPAVVNPGSTFSYTLAVENTSTVTQSLAVEDRLPADGSLLRCSSQSGSCVETAPGVIRWDIGSLAPGKRVSTTVSIHLDVLTSPDAVVEHTASLVDNRTAVLNVDTLSAQVGAATSERLIETPDKETKHFFVNNKQGVAEGDGLVQEIVSPWSFEHIAIVVTGLDEKALLRAAQALSAGAHFPGMWGEYAIIEAARPISESISLPFEDISLSMLGYDNQSIKGLHREYFQYYFDLSPGWKLSEDAFVALHISHGMTSRNVRTTTEPSSLELELNELPFGSAVLDESNAHDSWIMFPLPAPGTQAGTNTLKVRVSVAFEDICTYITSDRYWLTVYADSFLHLPRRMTELVLDLDNLPAPFSNRPDLGNLVFLLPERPKLAEIEGVLRFAHQLGSATEGYVLWPQVVLGEQSDVKSWSGYHIIAVGLPASNPYLAAANDDLPQPFRPGTNEILQEIDQVVYRLPPGVSLGYVQELPSPWDKDRAMLAVTGTTDEGVAWALNSLTDLQLSWRLSGNLALIRDQNIWSMDTREIHPEAVVGITQIVKPTPVLSATPALTPTLTPSPSLTMTLTALPTSTPTALPTFTPSPVATALSEVSPPVMGPSRPGWLIPLLVTSALVVVISVGIAAWKSRS